MSIIVILGCSGNIIYFYLEMPDPSFFFARSPYQFVEQFLFFLNCVFCYLIEDLWFFVLDHELDLAFMNLIHCIFHWICSWESIVIRYRRPSACTPSLSFLWEIMMVPAMNKNKEVKTCLCKTLNSKLPPAILVPYIKSKNNSSWSVKFY